MRDEWWERPVCFLCDFWWLLLLLLALLLTGIFTRGYWLPLLQGNAPASPPVPLATQALLLPTNTLAPLTADTPIPTAGETAIPAAPTSTNPPESPQAGFLAPNFSLRTIDDQDLTLSDRFGKPIIMTFWATWCTFCRDEMPALQQARDQYGEQIEIIAINITNQDTLSEIQPYLTSIGATFPVPLDVDGSVQSLYNASAFPTTIFIRKTGVIDEVVEGAQSFASLQTRIDTLLAMP